MKEKYHIYNPHFIHHSTCNMSPRACSTKVMFLWYWYMHTLWGMSLLKSIVSGRQALKLVSLIQSSVYSSVYSVNSSCVVMSRYFLLSISDNIDIVFTTWCHPAVVRVEVEIADTLSDIICYLVHWWGPLMTAASFCRVDIIVCCQIYDDSLPLWWGLWQGWLRSSFWCTSD